MPVDERRRLRESLPIVSEENKKTFEKEYKLWQENRRIELQDKAARLENTLRERGLTEAHR
ncbi:MAG: hypothetical protein N2258_05850, partial [Brevinematales bacterium]|nr:hypothetical protein [Brevinematales bacterium]